MTDSSGSADKQIQGLLPISIQDKLEELRRLVAVLRFNLAIVYDRRVGAGQPTEIKALLERISEQQIPLRILVDGDTISFLPLDAEESNFVHGAMILDGSRGKPSTRWRRSTASAPKSRSGWTSWSS